MFHVHRHPQLNGDFRSVTSSQTTTEAEEEEEEDNSFVEAEGESGADEGKSLDPALLQALSFAANLTLQEEEDTLGKVRTVYPIPLPCPALCGVCECIVLYTVPRRLPCHSLGPQTPQVRVRDVVTFCGSLHVVVHTHIHTTYTQSRAFVSLC